MKNIDWLNKFAEDRAEKETVMTKTASAKFVVDADDVTGKIANGSIVTFQGKKCKVVNASYADSKGEGVMLLRLADGEEAPMDGGEGGEVEAKFEKKDDSADSADEDKVTLEKDEKGQFVVVDGKKIYVSAKPEKTAEFAPEVTEEISPEATPAVAPAPATGNVSGQPIGTQQKCTDSPERARVDPGSVYDMDARDAEQAKFEGEANATVNAIAQEDGVDRTTVDGHYTWNKLINNIVNDTELVGEPAVAPATEAPVAEEAPATEEVEPAVEEQAEEVVEEEKPEEKKPAIAITNRILKKVLSSK